MPNRRFTAADEAALLQIPGIARAVELFAVGDNLNGRREWYQQVEQQDKETQHAMAYLAQRLGQAVSGHSDRQRRAGARRSYPAIPNGLWSIL